jgi:ABC-2 type transport system ATP-binding protein
MKQRLGIAQLLLNDPRVVIVDEPTAGLDPHERVSFRRLIGELCRTRADRIVIVSTHIVEDLAHLAPTITVLSEGQILFSGAAGDLESHAGPSASLEEGYLALLEGR